MKQHLYRSQVTWTGNRGVGTPDYRGYDRTHEILVAGKPPIPASSDPSFRGEPNRYNPEELLVASLSSCHMLWYLHLCSVGGVSVMEYLDEAEGTMAEEEDGEGAFTGVVLRPRVVVRSGDDLRQAAVLHDEAHRLCFIARSVNFPVRHEPSILAG